MKRQRLCYVRRYLRTITFLTAGFCLGLGLLPDAVLPQSGTISGPAYQLLSQRMVANQTRFYVYLDQDAGLNHGFPSGKLGSPCNLDTIHIDTGCIDDPNATNGCSTDPDALDRVRVTVMRISFDPQTPGHCAGVNIEEPENYGALLSQGLPTGNPYDLTGAANIVFDVRSPDQAPTQATVQFGVGQCVTKFITIGPAWTTMTIPLNSLGTPPDALQPCTPDLQNVHVLFTVVTNAAHAPQGGTVLLDNIRFDPVPTSQQSALGFPLSNQTFGVLPQQNVPIPPDQVLRNLTTIYETALTEVALLARGTAQDLMNARLIADAFDAALHHDNHGDALPVAPDGSVGLHNGYENGDLALFNTQQLAKAGQAGDVRLAGFTATVLCPLSGFCLMLDGATGGNNAFAILALVAAFKQFGDVRYLNDAVTIGQWIVGNLTDPSGTGYGGYFVGYPDMGVPPPKPLQTGKSIENNADIFAALTALATVEAQRGNTSAAANWTAAANVAGDFVMQMFDATQGRFNAGTVPVGTAPEPAVCPNGPQQGNDVMNTCDFLDANTFTTLALAGASRYRNQIDWCQPITYMLSHFTSSVTAAGQPFNGFDLVPPKTPGSNGVAWEFTGQAVVAMRYVDQLYAQTTFEASAAAYVAELRHAQTAAPFGDGVGLVASTLDAGDTLPPLDQCLVTPFQCIAERVGLAATTWAIFADQNINPFSTSSSTPSPVVSLSPTSLVFTSQLVGMASSPQVVTLRNTGTATLTITSIAGSGDFAQTNNCGSALNAGASCTISVTFTPTATGNRTGTLTSTDNAAGSLHTVSLSGTGTSSTPPPQGVGGGGGGCAIGGPVDVGTAAGHVLILLIPALVHGCMRLRRKRKGSYWIPGSWNLRIVYTEEVVFQKWRSTAIDVTLSLRLMYPKARREVHDIERGPLPSLSQ